MKVFRVVVLAAVASHLAVSLWLAGVFIWQGIVAKSGTPAAEAALTAMHLVFPAAAMLAIVESVIRRRWFFLGAWALPLGLFALDLGVFIFDRATGAEIAPPSWALAVFDVYLVVLGVFHITWETAVRANAIKKD